MDKLYVPSVYDSVEVDKLISITKHYTGNRMQVTHNVADIEHLSDGGIMFVMCKECIDIIARDLLCNPDIIKNMIHSYGYRLPYRYRGKVIYFVFLPEPNMVSYNPYEEATKFARFGYMDNTRLVDIPDCKTTLCTDFILVQEALEDLQVAECVAFDFETTGLTLFSSEQSHDIFSISFCLDGKDTVAIPLYKYWTDSQLEYIYKAITNWLCVCDSVKIAHNLSFELLWMFEKIVKVTNLEYYESFKIGGRLEDTMLLQGINFDRVSLITSLKFCVFKYFGVPDYGLDFTDRNTVLVYPLDDVLIYNGYDSHYTYYLYQYLTGRLASFCTEDKLMWVYNEIQMPANIETTEVTLRGLLIDVNRLNGYVDASGEVVAKHEKLTIDAFGIPDINIRSVPQLKNAFSGIGHNLYSTRAEVLKGIADVCEPAKCLLDYKAVNQLNGTFLLPIKNKTDKNGYLHPSYNFANTVTGRTSSSNPNIQNIPKRTIGAYVRDVFITPKNYKLVAFDYGQIEARLFAILSGDKTFVDDLYSGYDIHMEKAIDLYHHGLGMSLEDAKARRSSVKANLVFAGFYGAGINTMSGKLDAPPDIIRNIKDSIMARYPDIVSWQESIKTTSELYGYSESLFGKRRYEPVRYTQRLNFVPQSSASDMTLVSMIHLAKIFKVIMVIHDDITFLLKDDDTLSSSIEFIIKAMLTIPFVYIKDSVYLKSYAPLSVEASMGDDWLNKKDVVTLDNLAFGLDTIDKSVSVGLECIEACKV